MTLILAAGLGEACPSLTHHPGEPDAVIPYAATGDGTGGLTARYRCPCGRAWVTWWDAGAAAWPIDRTEVRNRAA